MPITELTGADYLAAAKRLQWDVATVKAIVSVESSGSGFLDDGRVKVNYEPHVMFRRLRENFNLKRAEDELARYPDLVAKEYGGHLKGPKGEDADMDRAATLIDRKSALESASWGAFQIMGYHWKSLGYKSVQEFVNAMYSAAGQLEAFIRFVVADQRLLLAGRRRDWGTFASIYNGPGYRKFRYDERMEEAYRRNAV